MLALALVCGPVFVAADASLGPLRAQPQGSADAGGRPQVVTTGHGEAHAVPDRATLLISVETRGTTAAAAAADNATRQRAILDALRALGLPRTQLFTAGYNVEPEYNYGNGKLPHVIDYVARNTIRAELRQLDQVGRAIDAALAAGATTVSGVEFTASNADSARHAALGAAVTQARGDADVMARAAGGGLGALLEITNTESPPVARPLMRVPQAHAMGIAAPQPPTEIDAGDITVTVDVTARWAFVGGEIR